MTRRAWACLLFACVALLARDGGAVRAQPRPVQIQPDRPPPVFAAGGTDIFRALLAREGFAPVTRNDAQWMRFDSNVAVVVIGNGWADVREPFGSVRDAVRNDGAGLIALDSQVALASAFNGNRVAARVSGATITAAAQDGHNNRTDCPYAVPLSPEEMRPRIDNPGPVFGLFRGLNSVATNEPSDIRADQFVGEYAHPLARFPKSAMVNGFRPAGNQPPLLAIGGDGPRKKPDDEAFAFLAVADSSIFINQMMLEPGTDNFQFAERVAKYLKGPERRTRCLFFENGRIVEDFNSLRDALTPQAPPLPQNKVPNLGPLIGKNQDKLVKLIDDKLDEFQRKDIVHRVAMGEPDSPRERSQFAKFVTVFLVYLPLRFLLLWLRVSAWTAKHPTDIPHPPTTGAGAASTGPTGVFDRRRRELMRRNNVFDPVSHLMREFFLSTGVAADLGPRIPRVWVTDSVRRPDSLRQAVRDMWRIAFGPPMPLSAQRWFEIEPYFDRLRQAYADGKWKFVLPE